MSWYLPNASGNYGTAATWDTVSNTPTIHATTNITLATAGSFSATFTAPNIINASTGVCILSVAQSTTTTVTATLQEDITGTSSWLDTAATSTVTFANVNVGWLYFRWAAPYTYATTGTGRYRIKVSHSSGGSPTAAADSGGLNFMYMHTDDRHTVPVAGDSIWVIGANSATATTVTVDGTRACGNEGTLAANAPLASRTITVSAMIGQGGMLSWDTTANSQLTSKGNIVVDVNGEFRMGTVASPIPVANTCTLIFDMTTTDTVGLSVLNNSRCIIQGAPKSSTSLWKTTYVSGAGTAAAPLVVADPVDWQVGDEIITTPGTNSATNYNEAEKKFIITKNSATSYVLSTTSGGTEAAYSFTHIATSEIVNLTRNAYIKGVSTSLNTFVNFASQTNTGNVNVDWYRVDNTCNQSVLAGTFISNRVAVDYSVVYRPGRLGFSIAGSLVTSHVGLICVDNTNATSSSTGGGYWMSGNKNKSLTDCYAINNQGAGFSIVSSFSNTFTRCKAIACMKGLVTSLGGWAFTTSGLLTFTNCEAQANRFAGITLSAATDCSASGFLVGNKATNQTVDINVASTTYNTTTFTNSLFGSTTFVSNYLNMIDGSEVRFHKLSQTTNNHRWYTPYGSAQSTGAALADTTVRTSGSLGLRITSEDGTDGFTWKFHIPSKAMSITNFFGWFELNSTFTGDVAATARVELWLPGAASASATSPLSLLTNAWQSVVLSATNTDSTDGLAEIRVVGVTATVGAYLYADDFYNAGDTVTNSDKVTGLDTWFNGKPIDIIQPTATSAADIWSFPTTNLTTAGTTGNQVKKLLTVAKFLGLK